MNSGKMFEQDFKQSSEKVMAIIRLYDQAASFGGGSKTRFSPRNICDFISYRYPFIYLLELKSHKGKSIPFVNIVTKDSDKRLGKMVELSQRLGIRAYIIFNWRDVGNDTFAVPANLIEKYIKTAPRKSIPHEYTKDFGIKIGSKLKRVRYSYDVLDLMRG